MPSSSNRLKEIPTLNNILVGKIVEMLPFSLILGVSIKCYNAYAAYFGKIYQNIKKAFVYPLDKTISLLGIYCSNISASLQNNIQYYL